MLGFHCEKLFFEKSNFLAAVCVTRYKTSSKLASFAGGRVFFFAVFVNQTSTAFLTLIREARHSVFGASMVRIFSCLRREPASGASNV